MLPVMARNLLESIRLLANVSRLLADRCIDGIEADVERCRAYAESSPSIVTPLNQLHRLREGGGGRQAGPEGEQDDPGGRARARSVDDGKLTEAQLDAALDVLSMTHP